MFIAATITAIVALTITVAMLLWISNKEERPVVLLCLVCTAPMCWLMYHCVRVPLDGLLVSWLGDGAAMSWIRTAYAPITEEPAKLWPLLLPFVRKAITTGNISKFALALGGGFAIGEVLTVAGLIHDKSPEIAALPWYQLGGFMQERIMTCVIHPGMTVVALWLLRNHNNFFGGLLAAMTVHYLANFPIAMARQGWLGTNVVIVQSILVLWVMFCAVAAFGILFYLRGNSRKAGTLFFGEAICPSCKTRYERSLLKGANFGFSLRYEPCPACNKWHWTRRAPEEE